MIIKHIYIYNVNESKRVRVDRVFLVLVGHFHKILFGLQKLSKIPFQKNIASPNISHMPPWSAMQLLWGPCHLNSLGGIFGQISLLSCDFTSSIFILIQKYFNLVKKNNTAPPHTTALTTRYCMEVSYLLHKRPFLSGLRARVVWGLTLSFVGLVKCQKHHLSLSAVSQTFTNILSWYQIQNLKKIFWVQEFIMNLQSGNTTLPPFSLNVDPCCEFYQIVISLAPQKGEIFLVNLNRVVPASKKQATSLKNL